MKTLEEKTAAAVLQQGRRLDVGGRLYEVKPASVRTLIEVSRKISRLPQFNKTEEKNAMYQILAYAQHGEPVGDVIATMMLGSRGTFSPLHAARLRLLARRILDLPPRRMQELLKELLDGLEAGFFYGIITSLSEINMLRQKKAEKTKTTASGQ